MSLTHPRNAPPPMYRRARGATNDRRRARGGGNRQSCPHRCRGKPPPGEPRMCARLAVARGAGCSRGPSREDRSCRAPRSHPSRDTNSMRKGTRTRSSMGGRHGGRCAGHSLDQNCSSRRPEGGRGGGRSSQVDGRSAAAAISSPDGAATVPREDGGNGTRRGVGLGRFLGGGLGVSGGHCGGRARQCQGGIGLGLSRCQDSDRGSASSPRDSGWLLLSRDSKLLPVGRGRGIPSEGFTVFASVGGGGVVGRPWVRKKDAAAPGPHREKVGVKASQTCRSKFPMEILSGELPPAEDVTGGVSCVVEGLLEFRHEGVQLVLLWRLGDALGRSWCLVHGPLPGWGFVGVGPNLLVQQFVVDQGRNVETAEANFSSYPTGTW